MCDESAVNRERRHLVNAISRIRVRSPVSENMRRVTFSSEARLGGQLVERRDPSVGKPEEREACKHRNKLALVRLFLVCVTMFSAITLSSSRQSTMSTMSVKMAGVTFVATSVQAVQNLAVVVIHQIHSGQEAQQSNKTDGACGFLGRGERFVVD